MQRSNEAVYLIDDDDAARESLKFLLESKGFKITCFKSPVHWLNTLDESVVCCLLLDLRMPAIDGLELQQMLIDRNMPTPIIFISGDVDVSSATRALRNGAIDLLEKPVDGKVLAARVERALDVSRREHSARAEKRRIQSLISSLTDREREFLPLVFEGQSLKQIARHFGVTVPTASRHQSRTFEKMEVDSTAQLIRLLNSVNFDISRVL